MSLHVVDFLRAADMRKAFEPCDGLALLKEKYAISAKRHKTFPELVLLKYDMVSSPMEEQIVRECRGIILNESDNWSVVGRGFDKFFNLGEPHAATIDWKTARVQEKCDGSLIMLYRYAGTWQVATSGSPDASGSVLDGTETFRDYFLQTLEAVGGRFPLGFSEDICVLLELMGPKNRVIVVHQEPHIRVLGARARNTGMWLKGWGIAESMGLPMVQGFDLLFSFEDIAASFQTMSPMTQEGYVVVDDAGNRVKVKHPGYVALHHAKDGLSWKSMVNIARSGEASEVVSAFPEWKGVLQKASDRLESLLLSAECAYMNASHLTDKKEFAMAVKDHPLSGAIFAKRNGRVATFKQYFEELPIDKLVDLLGPE